MSTSLGSALRATADAGAARRAARLVGWAALDSAAVPAAAMLIVRRLPDPLPRRLADDDAPVASPAWERALRARVAECYRGAARPARGPVLGLVNAVCFEDRAELLACLARDALAGAVEGRWWWHAFLRGTGRDLAAVLGALWGEDAVLLPAVLDRLARAGQAVAFVHDLTPVATARALRAVALAFDAPALIAPPAWIGGQADRPASAGPAPSTLVETGQATTPPPVPAPPAPPWATIAPEVPLPPELSAHTAALLGVCLALARAPLRARSRAFARALHQWRAAIEAGAEPPTAPAPASASPPAPVPAPPRQTSTPPPRPLAEASAGPAIAGGLPREGPPASSTPPSRPDEQPVPGSTAPRGPTPEQVAASSPLGSGSTAGAGAIEPSVDSPPAAVPAEDGQATPANADAAVAAIAAASPVQSPSRPRPAITSAAPPNAPGPAAVSTEAGIVTELGGVLFLVNALRRLRFFDLLEEHFDVEATFGGWGWIELVARALLSERAGWAAADPLWRVLAELDGRPAGDPLPCALRAAADEYRLPDEWRGDAGRDPVFVRYRAGRIQLWHGSAFPLADWQLRAGCARAEVLSAARTRWPDLLPPRPPCHAARDRRRVARRAACVPLGVRPDPELQRFLELVLPYLRWRIAAALGADELSAGAAARLLRRGGWLYVTGTHVDLRLPLELADVATRRAGLDADPGWVPALARVVSFFFDAGEP